MKVGIKRSMKLPKATVLFVKKIRAYWILAPHVPQNITEKLMKSSRRIEVSILLLDGY